MASIDSTLLLPFFVAYPPYSRNSQDRQPRHDNNIPCNMIWQIYSDKKQLLKKETSQNESRLQFSQRQFKHQRQCESPNSIQKRMRIPASLKDDFASRRDLFIFTSITPQLFEWLNETRSVFPALRPTGFFLTQSMASRRSDSSSEANSSCCLKSEEQ